MIWQKDPRVSADFVRGLLNESANQYGEEEAYGNGLVDAEYALEHYDEYKEKYDENAQQVTDVQEDAEKEETLIPENESEITTFEETGCVEGSWRVVETEVKDKEKRRDHVSMIDESFFNVRMGVRLPDYKNDDGKTNKSITNGDNTYEYDFGNKNDARKNGEDSRKIAGMTPNPWWHGYYTEGVYDNNYIMSVIYATRMAKAIGDGRGVDAAATTFSNGVQYAYAEDMKQDIKDFYNEEEKGWKYILARMKSLNSGNKSAQQQGNTNGFKKAVVWGMAIHSATDIYAHSTQIGTGKGAITHEGGAADNPDYCVWRYIEATEVARQLMERYEENEEVVAADLLPVTFTIDGRTEGTTRRYTLTKFTEFLQQVDRSLTYFPDYTK